MKESLYKMTVKEVVEYYLSGNDLSEHDDVLVQELYWNYIVTANSIVDLQQRAEYLNTLNFCLDDELEFICEV